MTGKGEEGGGVVVMEEGVYEEGECEKYSQSGEVKDGVNLQGRIV